MRIGSYRILIFSRGRAEKAEQKPCSDELLVIE
jgi:hypothetical protein